MFGFRTFGEAALCEQAMILPPRGSRPMTSAAATALQQEIVRACLLFEGEFNELVRLSNGAADVTWNGNVYTAVGSFAGVSPMEETDAPQANGIECYLSGIPTDLVALMMVEHYQGKTARIYLALFDADHQLIPDPILLFSGRMDNCTIEMGKEARISLRVMSRLADWERPRIRRQTDEDQQSRYPGDKFFAFVPQMVEWRGVWGRT